MWLFLLQGLTLGFPAAAVPGPSQAFYLTQTLQIGWKRTLPLTLTPLLSDGLTIIISLLILNQMPTMMMTLLQLVGSGFLIYLAWGAFQSFWHHQPTQISSENETPSPGLLKAILIHLLNPNVWLFWGTVGSIRLLHAWHTAPGHAVGFLVGVYATLIGGYALLVVLLGLLGRVDDQKGRISRALTLISALALLFFAIVYQLIPALTYALA